MFLLQSPAARSFIAVMLATELSACTGVSYDRHVADLVDDRCVVCHQGDTPEGELDLSSDAYAAMVGVPSTQSPDMMLIAPGDSLYSYVWHKLNGSQSIAGGSGTYMPVGTPLSDEDLLVVERWIDEGAKR